MTTAAPPAPASPRTTPRGTPCAHSWSDAWVAQVEAREEAMARRICGARTVGGTPCPLPSEHFSGRCRHHGGFPLTGAPHDNRNAVVHGLYSRRLMICGTHCPAWQSCPMGGGSAFVMENEISAGGRVSSRAGDRLNDAAREDARPLSAANEPPLSYGQQLMKLPLAERPLCPYEQAEYNASVTDVMKRTQARAENSFGLHLAHQVALLTVMVSRAARALATKPFTEKMEQSAENYYMSVDKPSAGLVAFEKLSRELRRWIAMIEKDYPPYNTEVITKREHELRRQCDTNPGPDEAAALDLSGKIAQMENAKNAAAWTANLMQMDKQIVETMFARFGVKAQGQNPSTAEDAEDTEEVKGEGTERQAREAQDQDSRDRRERDAADRLAESRLSTQSTSNPTEFSEVLYVP